MAKPISTGNARTDAATRGGTECAGAVPQAQRVATRDDRQAQEDARPLAAATIAPAHVVAPDRERAEHDQRDTGAGQRGPEAGLRAAVGAWAEPVQP